MGAGWLCRGVRDPAGLESLAAGYSWSQTYSSTVHCLLQRVSFFQCLERLKGVFLLLMCRDTSTHFSYHNLLYVVFFPKKLQKLGFSSFLGLRSVMQVTSLQSESSLKDLSASVFTSNIIAKVTI